MNQIDFVKRFSHAQIEELLVVTASTQFVPEAVEAAKAELARRKVNPSELVRQKAHLEDLQRSIENKGSVPLSTAAKIAFFTFGVFLLPSLLMAITLRTSGSTRKSKEAFKWIGISCVFWLSFGFIVSAIS